MRINIEPDKIGKFLFYAVILATTLSLVSHNVKADEINVISKTQVSVNFVLADMLTYMPEEVKTDAKKIKTCFQFSDGLYQCDTENKEKTLLIKRDGSTTLVDRSSGRVKINRYDSTLSRMRARIYY